MIQFSIETPRFVTECLHREQSLVVTYGRLHAQETPKLTVYIWGVEVTRYDPAEVRVGKGFKLDKGALESRLTLAMQEGIRTGRHNKPTSSQLKEMVGLIVDRSLLIQWLSVLDKPKLQKTMQIQSIVKHRWIEKRFEFDDEPSPVFGEHICVQIEPPYTWNEYTPPEQQNRRRARIVDRTLNDAITTIGNELNFWLFGPVL